MTTLLTTQYLEEADRLADEIVVIDHGEVIERGTPAELKRRVGGEQIEVRRRRTPADAPRVVDGAGARSRAATSHVERRRRAAW